MDKSNAFNIANINFECSQTNLFITENSLADSDDDGKDDISGICSAHQSLVVNQMFSAVETKPQRSQIELILDLYSRVNVERQETLVLQPKFKTFNSFKGYILPTYYDTIYMMNQD